MRIQSLLFLSVVFSVLFSTQLQATVFHAKADGYWYDSSTWFEPGTPGPGDQVVIDGYKVTYDTDQGDLTVDEIDLQNTTGDDSKLKVIGGKTLTILSDLRVTASHDSYVALEIEGDATLDVQGVLYFNRVIGNSSDEKMQLKIKDNGKVFVGGDFIFDHNDSGNGENENEIVLEGKGSITVTGNVTLRNDGGESFSMELKDEAKAIFNSHLVMEFTSGTDFLVGSSSGASLIQVGGNMTMVNSGGVGSFILGYGFTGGVIIIDGNANLTSSIGGGQVMLTASGPDALVTVKKSINLVATANNSAVVGIVNQATLALGGTITRMSSYGKLQMDALSTLNLNGALPQLIPSSNFSGASTDSLLITNVSFNNTSGVPMVLQSPLIVNDYMEMNTGIIQSDNVNRVIIKDGAGIDTGNADSYVDGPVTKMGSTNSAPFVFPLGENGRYLPLEISALASAQSAYTATAKGDPPPFGNYETGVVGDIVDDVYWNLDRKTGSEPVDVTLHWDDLSGNNFLHMDSLIVVGLEGGTWFGYGNNGTTGALIGEGSVTSKGDPPPFGNLQFTVGQVIAPISSLPVEMIRFNAIQKNESIELHWATASESNTEYFSVERSTDGVNFGAIDNVASQGESEATQSYYTTDHSPLDGANFYRLKSVDKDGSYEYSSTALVKFETLPGVSIYPNPMSDAFVINGGSDFEIDGAKVEVFNASGNRIYSDKVNFENGRFQASAKVFNIDNAGTYLIRVTIAAKTYNMKLIKMD